MTPKELEIAVETAKSVIDPKLTWPASNYRDTIHEWLPEVCQTVIEAVDDHRDEESKHEKDPEKPGR